VALVGFVLGWRVGLVSLVGALLGELAGVFLACWVGDLLAGFLDPNSIQLSHYNNGWGALILILYVGVFLGPATVVTGVIGRLARYFFGGPAEHPSGTPS
jgi:hypothetical protein